MEKIALQVYGWITHQWVALTGFVVLSLCYIAMAFFSLIRNYLPDEAYSFFEFLYFNAWITMFYILCIIYLLAHAFERWPEFHKRFRSAAKPFASLKLAVIVILSIAALTAAGTIIEAKFNDAKAASAYVYHTPWMYGVLLLLCLNLIGVMVDRLPWQRRHAGFIFAHIGIILTLLGALETSRKGVDGSLALGFGEAGRFVSLGGTEISLHSSFDGARFSKVYNKDADVFKTDFREAPLRIPLSGTDQIEVLDSMKYAVGSQKVVSSESERDGGAIRFQLAGPAASSTEWIVQKRPMDDAIYALGPARISLRATEPLGAMGFNEIVLLPTDQPGQLKYLVFNKDPAKPTRRGVVKEGDTFDVGWMGFQFRLLRFLPKARQEWEFKALDQATPVTTSVVKVKFRGEEHWVQLNDMVKFFGNDAVYIFTYSNKRLDLGFNLKLDNFEVGRYQGTMRAMAYESSVDVENLGKVKISMNEPLKYRGYTFYQASFNEDEMGKPTASILSVNKDTGRLSKYMGCILIVLGTILMFYFKRKASKVVRNNNHLGRAS